MTSILKKLKTDNFTRDNKYKKVKKSKSSNNWLNSQANINENLYSYDNKNKIGYHNNYIKTNYNPPKEFIKLKETPEIVITESFKNKVDFLHSKVGSIEWSGLLIYKILKGSIEDPKNLLIEVEDIVLMDIGTASYTEYSLSKSLAEDDYVFDKVNSLMDNKSLKLGHIHTHHSMGAFFSGTDNKELADNTNAYNYYLSLIVNFQDCDKWCAKIAFEGEIEEKYYKSLSFKKDDGTLGFLNENKDNKEKSIFTYDCKISYVKTAPTVEESFAKRYEEIHSKKKVNNFYPGYNLSRFNETYNTKNNFKNSLFEESDFNKIPAIGKKDFNLLGKDNKKSKSNKKENEINDLLNEAVHESIEFLGGSIPFNKNSDYKINFKEFYKSVKGTSFDTYSLYTFIETLEDIVDEYVAINSLIVNKEIQLKSLINKELDILYKHCDIDENIITDVEFSI